MTQETIPWLGKETLLGVLPELLCTLRLYCYTRSGWKFMVTPDHEISCKRSLQFFCGKCSWGNSAFGEPDNVTYITVSVRLSDCFTKGPPPFISDKAVTLSARIVGNCFQGPHCCFWFSIHGGGEVMVATMSELLEMDRNSLLDLQIFWSPANLPVITCWPHMRL